MMSCCNSCHTNGRITRVTTITTTMAASSSERGAAIAIIIVVTIIPFSIGAVAVAAVHHMTLSAYMASLQ